MPEPWTMERLMNLSRDKLPPTFICSDLSVRNETIMTVVSEKFTIFSTTPAIAEAQCLNIQYGMSSLPDDVLPTLASSDSMTSLLYVHELLFLLFWLFWHGDDITHARITSARQ